MEWYPFFYKGHETNLEVNKIGEVRRVPKDWMNKTRLNAKFTSYKGYSFIGVTIKDIGNKTFGLHKILAVVFLNHEPDGFKTIVDHIDGNPSNNNLENLQIISNRQNNSKRKSKSKYGTGVYLQTMKYKNKIHKYFRAQIRINGKYNYLGLFKTPEEASAAYQEALRKINAGEFVTN